LARFVLFPAVMYKNRRTWSPNASAWARVFANAAAQVTTDGPETPRPPSEAAPAGSGDGRRLTDSHWECVIDRATD